MEAGVTTILSTDTQQAATRTSGTASPSTSTGKGFTDGDSDVRARDRRDAGRSEGARHYGAHPL